MRLLHRYFELLVIVAITIAFSVVSALAQTAAAPVVETPAWLNYVAVIGIAVTMALVGWGISIFNKKAGLENNATALEIEKHARDLLQTALTNLAGRAIVQLGPKINDAALTVTNPVIRSVAQALPNLASDAIQMFPQLRDPQVVAQKLIDKIGVLTASNPSANPTQQAGSAPPSA